MAGGIALELADYLYPNYTGDNPALRQIEESQAVADYQAEQKRLALAHDEITAATKR